MMVWRSHSPQKIKLLIEVASIRSLSIRCASCVVGPLTPRHGTTVSPLHHESWILLAADRRPPTCRWSLGCDETQSIHSLTTSQRLQCTVRQASRKRVVLVEYTEVVMPIIYSTFAASCQCLRDILTSIVRESSLGLGKCSHDVSARRAAASTDEFDVEMTDQGEKVERKSAEQPEALEENATPAAVAPIGDKWRFHDGKFKNRREQWLYYCAYFPHCGQDKMRGVVLFLHGIGEYARRFSHVFDVLCSHGFGVIAYDMISHGRSDSDEEGERAHALDFQHFVDDTNDFQHFVDDTNVFVSLTIGVNNVTSSTRSFDVLSV